jgi:hypothetical protein
MDEALDEPLFRLGHLATAAGIPPATLKRWLRHNYLCHEGGDQRGRGPGHYARFTLRTALRVALTAEQVKWGVRPQLAAQNARKFTDTDARPTEWLDDFGEGQPWRNPAECFETGSTWFVLDAASGFASVVHVTSGREATALFADLIPPSRCSLLTIDLNTMVFRVRYCLSTCTQLTIEAQRTGRAIAAERDGEGYPGRA